METRKRVVIAMSGGVDSSVAASLLVREGFEVAGMMLRLWSETGPDAINQCCSPDAMARARRVAAKLGIPFYAIDVQERFRREVVQYFIDGYLQGITPNPCMLCNRSIRWGFLLQHAQAFGAEFLATGHYARLRKKDDGRCELLKGVDEQKDQSYVLSMLTQEQLSKTLFPLGGYTKPQVRQIAREHGLGVAEKADSQDLCFIKDGNYRRFLLEHAERESMPGPIVNRQGQKLGEHQGFAHYTIGQRKGLGIASSEPFYVLEKDLSRNTIVVGRNDELGRDTLLASEVNWISGRAPELPFRAQIKIRYKAEFSWGLVSPIEGNRFIVKFDQTLRDITPGQIAVVYQDEVCLGGGIITG